ncbi:hypothetical protein ABH37_11860 [Mycobacterium haemophilum]|uniref:Uncharacterized protein n=1 Tax=Mycobacterium haemophilum TaxID=29311 RepID=A0A0I9U252_9MYCO|nr:hypothetical protein ABH39_09310 [Mycobacterium haemophilum]KLO36159.1 hypothetical protein ABH38_13230 [Mycobacterium haemophilum]KLO42008.1 hypothetical protein ABH37_11860 [Mycobacterium haemophilum]KLO49919.1 hypothetical protein ABH36_09780 [Mycobacterium haemophilum]
MCTGASRHIDRIAVSSSVGLDQICIWDGARCDRLADSDSNRHLFATNVDLARITDLLRLTQGSALGGAMNVI